MKKLNSNTKAYTFLLITTFLWGISPAIIKDGLNEIDSIRYLYIRHLICIFFYLPYILITKQVNKALSILKKPINVLSLVLITPITLIFLFWGIDRTTGIAASIASAFTPLIANILGAIFLKEEITKKEIIGTTLSFSGVVALTLMQNSTSELSLDKQIFGIILIIVGNIFFVVGNLLFKNIKQDRKTIANQNSYFLSVILLSLILLIKDPVALNITTIPTSSLPSILYMAIFGSLIAAATFQESLRYVEVSEANVFSYLQPLFGLPASVILLKEHFQLIMLIPLLIISIGIVLNVMEKFENLGKQ